MERYGIIGWPVAHSVSPAMQEAGFRALGRDAVYELYETAPDALADRFQQLRAAGLRGWNVTVPHKEAAVHLVDEIDPAAAKAGSVNTVVVRNGRLSGYSTDGYGLATALTEAFALPLVGSRQLYLGTGGAARAAAVYAALNGAVAIVLVNRTLARAEALAATILAAMPGFPVRCLPLADTASVAAALRQCDVLIQCTSLGLRPDDGLPLSASLLPRELAVYDMIYGRTPFLQAASEHGCRIADGRGMLLHQGCRSFELWSGQPAPVAAMREALNKALRQRN
ncbi:MAG: shikimate dehydrogenase [Lentisphaerae bacterium]|jgi:shikimate dehydrogenase|nr:shikimate dehydrogenase [Lentisphaerota bacterium]